MAGLTLEDWMTFGRDLATNTGFVLSDLDDAELSALLRVGAGVSAATQREIVARRPADEPQNDDDARDLPAAAQLLDVLDVCDLALSQGTPPPIVAAERSAITHPADWTPPPFQLGQTVFLRDSGNQRLLVVGLEFNRGIGSGDWWDVGVVERLRDITARQYSARELSAEPLVEDDADYQGYLQAGGALDWHAWRKLFDRYRELIPAMWRVPAPPEPPELTEIRRALLIADE